MAQPSGRALAQFLPFLTNDDGRAPGELIGPARHVRPGTAHRTRHEPRIGREIRIGLNVDQRRARRSADQASKLVDGDRGGRSHGASVRRGRGRDALAEASWGDRGPHLSSIPASGLEAQAERHKALVGT